jgi:ABC-2 type transport system permease protein
MTQLINTMPAAADLTYGWHRGFHNVIRSEFAKFFTVRSTYWMLAAAIVFNVGLAAALAIFVPGALSAQDMAAVDPTRLSLGGIHLSQVAFGVLGVLIITGEYGTGAIRTTFAAIPQRRRVLAAKAIVFSTTTLVLGILSSFAAFLVFQALLSGDALRTTLGDPGVLRAVFGGGLYVTVLGLLGLGLGAIVRSSAGAISALLGLLFVPPLLTGLLPPAWQATIRPYVPMEAGSQIFIVVNHEPNSLDPWTGFGFFALYAAIALTIGFVLIRHRDA